jgi:hypothetical protein
VAAVAAAGGGGATIMKCRRLLRDLAHLPVQSRLTTHVTGLNAFMGALLRNAPKVAQQPFRRKQTPKQCAEGH